ncbi:unknown [Bacteroides sp. CAG:144]|nr:unknown [Bacteroides sp. CAG:144]
MVAPVGTLVSVNVPSDVDKVAPFPLTEIVTPAIGALFSSSTVPDIFVRFCAEAISQQNIQHSTVYIVQNFFIILSPGI